jgi:hypothetical protein
LVAAFGKKEVRTTMEKEKTNIYAKVKEASYDKKLCYIVKVLNKNTAAFDE